MVESALPKPAPNPPQSLPKSAPVPYFGQKTPNKPLVVAKKTGDQDLRPWDSEPKTSPNPKP